MKFLKSVLRILLVLVTLIVVIGCCCVNSLMFHPQRPSYGPHSPGYVDIGTNGTHVAAIVLGPQHGKKAILRCHGNAEDANNTLWALRELAKEGYTIASVDYPGYGLSDGSPNETGCYQTVHQLYNWLIEKRGFRPEEIIINGFSIGTGPAVELAATHPAAKLILEAPFLSAPRVVTQVQVLPIDPFPNLKHIHHVKYPIVILHGTDDSVIPFNHGHKLFERAPGSKRFVKVEGADHNDLVSTFGIDTYLDFFRK